MRHLQTLLIALLAAAAPGWAGDWLTFGYDARRSGWARSEVTLNRDNVGDMVLKWKTTVENEEKSLAALTAPIVVTDVRVGEGRRARKDLVYIAGTGDVFYAIDALSGEIVWEKKFRTDVANKVPGMWLCPKGLNATPTVDRSKNTIYAISTDGRLYALDLATGKEKYRSQQWVPAFAKTWSLNRIGDVLYTPISQNCGDTVSGVTSIDVSDPENIVIRVWRSTPEYGAGVWGRAGVAIGKDGGIYAGTGDAPYNPGLRIFGNTMFRLDPDTLKLVDYYTPTNWEYVWKRDFDITASALVLDYKSRELVVIGGKEGVLYLMDAEDMGGLTHHDNLYTTPLLSNDDEWFEAKGLWGGFSSYVDARGRVWVYAPTWGPVSVQAPKFPIENGPNPNGSVMAFTVADHPDTGDPYLKPEWVSGDSAVPEPVAIANDVVFVLSNGENARQSINAGIMPFGEFNSEELLKDSQRIEHEDSARLQALDAQTGKVLFDSGPDAIDTWSHFTGIAVADGQVYAVDFSSTLYCFGLQDEE
ncbi:MAG: PQQ-binding-like beta-propeller repeat protein [Bryobacterales bacterium]|nr:PQQ-binding-like beta-propeller repeat protein [Bryobacterales bacterium]MDE0264465.1 PQQ-binding-like beta-propeller repeat protein [Bryobacterales bacterium]MDE0621262.1 PQQ-binding-like beta-propeller repeat protein [Bryobacterales bacterium]